MMADMHFLKPEVGWKAGRVASQHPTPLTCNKEVMPVLVLFAILRVKNVDSETEKKTGGITGINRAEIRIPPWIQLFASLDICRQWLQGNTDRACKHGLVNVCCSLVQNLWGRWRLDFILHYCGRISSVVVVFS